MSIVEVLEAMVMEVLLLSALVGGGLAIVALAHHKLKQWRGDEQEVSE